MTKRGIATELEVILCLSTHNVNVSSALKDLCDRIEADVRRDDASAMDGMLDDSRYICREIADLPIRHRAPQPIDGSQWTFCVHT